MVKEARKKRRVAAVIGGTVITTVFAQEYDAPQNITMPKSRRCTPHGVADGGLPIKKFQIKNGGDDTPQKQERIEKYRSM
jgi:hypothetical protein